MNDTRFVATEETVKALLDEFVEEQDKAIGRNGSRPRFMNFMVKDGIKATFVDAVNAFKAGGFVYAHKQATKALRDLRGAQQFYVMNSTVVFFPSRVTYIVDTTDGHISARIVKMFEDFKFMFATQDRNMIDLDRASTAYWELLDAIEKVPAEQEAAEANRRMLARAGKASKKQARRVEKEAEEALKAEANRAEAEQKRLARDRARAEAADSYLAAVQ